MSRQSEEPQHRSIFRKGLLWEESMKEKIEIFKLPKN